MKKKIHKKFFVFEIIASEFVAPNCVCQKENTCNRHSMCYETVLRFCIFVTESFFCKTITFPVINKYGKGAVLHISTMFGSI